MGHLLRFAKSSNALICAAIVNSWIDKTKWMPRIRPPDLITQMIKDGMPNCEFWVIGDTVVGYLSFNVEAQQITGLYVSHPGIGLGKAHLEQVKLGKSYIKLWSHSANTAAHRFYLREDFKRSGHEKIGGDGIKEICFEWVRKI